VRLRELLIGVEGLALLRHLYDGSDDAAERRLAEVRALLDDDAFSIGELTSEADPRTAYRSWSERYDESGNPVVALEEPVVDTLLDSIPRGRALDAACGTGRHARHLVERGHEVLGIDLSPEMLTRAAANVPEASFLEADLRDIPAPDEHFDLAVCALALAHLPELDAGVHELARVLKPGGRLVVSVLHPFQALLGWQAPFEHGPGKRGFVREHPHTHAEYLRAFRSAGLAVRGCAEPELKADQVQAKRRAFRHIPEATTQAYLGLPAVLVWDAEKR
jgi:ubiquinone/menaquinone biosynthesis C-methylase UbiE